MINIVLIFILAILVLYIFNNRQSNFEDEICNKENLNLITKQGCNDYKKICNDNFDETNCKYTQMQQKKLKILIYIKMF